jgi:hypothetical protein
VYNVTEDTHDTHCKVLQQMQYSQWTTLAHNPSERGVVTAATHLLLPKPDFKGHFNKYCSAAAVLLPQYNATTQAVRP